MNQIIILIAISLTLFSCKENVTTANNKPKEENKTTIEDSSMIPFSTKYPISDFKVSDVKAAFHYLHYKNYIFPDATSFKNKIIEKFSIDIDTVDYNKKDTIIWENPWLILNDVDYAKLNPEAYRENRFITPLIEDYLVDFFGEYDKFEKFPRERKETFFHFNNWVFHDDKASFAYLKAKKPYTFMHMIHEYEYIKDDRYVKFILESIKEDENTQDNINEMVMGWTKEKKGNYVRRNVVEKIIELDDSFAFYIAMIVSDSNEYTVKSIEQNEEKICSYETEEQRLEDIVYLMNVVVQQGIVGIIDELYHKNPMVLGLLKKHDFYNYKDLKSYSLGSFGQTPRDEDKPQPVYHLAVIDDPDGYTNVRDSKGKVLFKIQRGEEFMVSKSNKEIIGDFYKEGWWYVYFKNQKGWIHSSRVKIILD